MMTFDRDYIQRSGYTNLMQVVESLPTNFKGGASGATEVAPFGNAANYGQNLTRGTGFNLRGLGSSSTLTLINGRRVAPSAHGQFVDVSTIPLSAVERIEILTDGASAIYGADAVAGVVNIILRRDFEGMETGLQLAAADDGAVDERRLSNTIGGRWASGNVLVTTEYHNRSEFDVADRDFIMAAGADSPTWLLPQRELATLLFALDQQLPSGFDVNSTMLYAYEDVNQKFAFPGSIDTQSPITNRWSASAGLGYAAFGDWRLVLDGTIARVETDTDFTGHDAETGELTFHVDDYHDEFDTWSLDLKGDGTLFELPGGAVRLAVGGSYREDDLISTRVWLIPANGRQVRADDARQVTSAFAELYVPIIGAKQGFGWARRIDLSLAGRYDDYSDFGSTTNPKVGIVWSPIDSLDLRASVSSSFRAPNVAEKALGVRGVQISTGMMDAPDGSGTRIPIFYLLGSAPLTAEESDNLAVGLTWRPQMLSGFELSLDYFEIDYTNRISIPPYDEGSLSRREDFGDLITEIANDDAAQAYLEARLAAGDLFIDWEGIGSTGVRYALDLRQKNAARTRTSGFDVTTAYSFRHGADAFDLNLNVSHLREILTSLARDTTTFDQLDTYNQPLDWRGRFMATWARGGFATTVAVNHSDDYINDSFSVDVPIGSWTTVDLNLSYDFARRPHAPWLDGTRLSLAVTNLFDREPPDADSPLFPLGYDVFNADAIGRYVAARVSKRW
jgi:outer membrane receptor protein involved in Fe transport